MSMALFKTEPKHMVFIDTEFTDFKNSQMISIGLVSETGAELYLETTFPQNECSDFVKAVVWPLLWHTPDVTVTSLEIRDRLVTWLDSIRRGDEDITIMFDYITDWTLFGEALDYRLPPYISAACIGPNHFSKKVAKEWMEQQGLAEHHALYDARANMYAYFHELNRKQKQQEINRV
jgi:hypothetical protein